MGVCWSRPKNQEEEEDLGHEIPIDLYGGGASNSGEVVIDNSDLYSGFSIAKSNEATREVLYKNYTDVVPTITSATAAPFDTSEALYKKYTDVVPTITSATALPLNCGLKASVRHHDDVKSLPAPKPTSQAHCGAFSKDDYNVSVKIMCEETEEVYLVRKLGDTRPETYEAEVTCTGETGLHYCLLTCTKNPDHQNFIPINSFNINHLPSRYRDKLIVDYVRATSDVTCRLSMPHISESRHKNWPGSDQAAPLSAQKGDGHLKVGTGWVNYVVKYREEDNIKCECEECHSLGTNEPNTTWGIVYLRTACHVVKNDEEARHTKCQFFYDSHETDINTVLTITGLKVVGSDIKGDWCVMTYATHDMQLLDKFDRMCRRWRDLRNKLFTKYRYLLKKSPDVCASVEVSKTNARHDLCIIVSHPHGCSKTVTVGKLTKISPVRTDDFGNEEIAYHYNTPTCPGSGGAPVITLVEDIRLHDELSHPTAHSQGHPGYQEAEMSFTAEVGLHQSIILCEKNPDHRDFISIEDFSIRHLPKRYRDDLIMKFVKATSGIVCRLSVPDISGDSPKTRPDSEQPLLTSPMMVGTGWVTLVVNYTEEDGEDCQCMECCEPGTETPKKTWGVVYLRTASHVVYSDEVASHTQCHLFYDSHEKTLKTVPTLSGFEVLNRDIEGDWCEMISVTHDVKLLATLHEMCGQWLDQRSKVHHKYLHKGYPGVGCDTNARHDLCIIVSHPHGCSKTVTVGRWTQRQLVRKNGSGKEEIKYSYDTPTCPGSSGAPINTLVEDIKLQDGLSHPPAHSQGGAGNDNSSGIGMEQFRLPLA